MSDPIFIHVYLDKRDRIPNHLAILSAIAPPKTQRSQIERTAHSFPPAIENMSINHRRLHILVSEQFLYGRNSAERGWHRAPGQAASEDGTALSCFGDVLVGIK
jgi:hypothetical protein